MFTVLSIRADNAMTHAQALRHPCRGWVLRALCVQVWCCDFRVNHRLERIPVNQSTVLVLVLEFCTHRFAICNPGIWTECGSNKAVDQPKKVRLYYTLDYITQWAGGLDPGTCQFPTTRHVLSLAPWWPQGLVSTIN
jgi:hypothetical protein